MSPDPTTTAPSETEQGGVHRLLARQLKRAGIENPSSPPDARQWAELLEKVSASYREAEQDRYMLERALSVSSRELQDMNEARGKFFSHVSQELRNPLALILGPVESVLKGRESASEHLFYSIASNARRLQRYVDVLLELANNASGEVSLDPEGLKKRFEDETARGSSDPGATDAASGTDDREEVAKLNREAQAARKAGRPTVLCVDGNMALLRYLYGLLKDRYNVIVSVDGWDALEKAMTGSPDLILSELGIPGLDGIALCRAIRGDSDLQFVSFVLLTAKSDPGARVEGLEAGADDFMAKPFSEPELLARIENLVRLRERQRRLKQDLQAARTLQRAILPQARHGLGGAELEAFFKPSEELSGDFYDIARVNDGERILFYLADVTQHGTASAQVTFLLKEIFLGVFDRAKDLPLGQVLREAAKRYARYGLDYGVAIQALEYRPATRELEYIRAGAPPGVRVGKAGAGYLTGPSTFSLSKAYVDPGPAGEDSLASTTVSLEPGDQVFFFTDGLSALGSRERAAGSRYALRLLEEASSGDWMRSLLKVVEEARSHSPIDDDVSVLRLSISK